MKYKPFILGVTLLGLSNIATAQIEAIEISYDPVGNRTLREYNNNFTLRKYRGDTLHHDSPADTIKYANKSIALKAYPNPTSDYITIENLDFNIIDKITVSVYDMNGKFIFAVNESDAKIQVPLVNVVPGVYQLRYFIGDRLVNFWKVVRK